MKPAMSQSKPKTGDSAALESAHQVLAGESHKRGLARLWPFLGPAFLASIAYVDPGNFATNIQGGARFGYTLLWVVVASSTAAILVQILSAKLGIATGYNLAELCRLHFPRPVVLAMWVLMEMVAMATDLAELLGAALGISLLFGMPMWAAIVPTVAATFMILALQARGFRPLEAVISGMLGIIAACYVIEIFLSDQNWGEVARSAVLPRFAGTESVLLATGILGATIMPHVIFLHSSLTQGRIQVKDIRQKRLLLKFEVVDVTIAMGVAGFVNAAILMMAAATFHFSGHSGVASLEDAYLTLQPLLGRAAGWIFAVSLLISGLASTTIGTISGQVIMQGFVTRRIPIWVRRLVTILPSVIIIVLGFDPTWTLVISQVVLSFGLPFALVPLVLFSQRRDIMGELANRRMTTIAGWTITGLVVVLNLLLLFLTASGS
jgi:manganese transport protein